MTRQQRIEKGLVWVVYPDGKLETKDVMFEGTKSKCNSYLRKNNLMGDWKKGKIRTGKVIYEG